MKIARGEIWFADCGEPVGREQGYPRPALVISNEDLNSSRLAMVIAIPLTRSQRGWHTHVRIDSAGTGLKSTSWAMVEQTRSMSPERFEFRIGRVPEEVVEEAVALLEGMM